MSSSLNPEGKPAGLCDVRWAAAVAMTAKPSRVDSYRQRYVTGDYLLHRFSGHARARLRHDLQCRQPFPGCLCRQVERERHGLAYATYLGGEFKQWGTGIAVDDAGEAFVTGGNLVRLLSDHARRLRHEQQRRRRCLCRQAERGGQRICATPPSSAGSESIAVPISPWTVTGRPTSTGCTDSDDFPAARWPCLRHHAPTTATMALSSS